MSDRGKRGAGGGSAVYGLGFIGAAIFYFWEASTAWGYVLALPKAVVWPVLLVFDALYALHS